VRVVQVPWAEPHGRFTVLFERLVIAWLRDASQRAVARRLGLTWDEVHGIMQRAVRRGLSRRAAEPLRHVGVDEKSFRKRHRYATLVNDLERGRVLYVAEDRKQSSLDGFWSSLTAEQKQSIEAVAMDMWDPYVASTRAHLEGADEKIVYDKFQAQ
jgi:transposase